jgi:hypothetical protein
MNTCPDILVWNIAMAFGVITSAVSLWLSVGDRRALTEHLEDREADEARRQLNPLMVKRMDRNADHAMFAEAMRFLALSGFLYIGLTALFGPTPSLCAFSLNRTIFIVCGVLVALNSVHALYTRVGNDFSEGPSDHTDAARDTARDAHRDLGRDEGRDEIRDPARDIARDKQRDEAEPN